jgi:leucyl-tRNA synthetase
MELVNEIYYAMRLAPCALGEEQERTTHNAQRTALNEAIKIVVLLLSPFVPHITEEMWQLLGNKESILKIKWPAYDPELIKEETITYVIQVNGKVRSKIELSADIDEEELKKAVLGDDKLKPWVAGKVIKKFIVVPKKLVNIVV